MNRELPIIMCSEMVKAIKEGCKTQTRRLIDLPSDVQWQFTGKSGKDDDSYRFEHCGKDGLIDGCCFRKTRYQVGNELWVKEPHYLYGAWFKNGLTKTGRQKWRFTYARSKGVKYLDAPPENVHTKKEEVGWFKRTGRFMPKWAARLWLRVTAIIDPHQVQNISEEDAIAEGIEIVHADTKLGHIFTGTGYWDTVSHHCIHGGKTYHVASTGGICQCNEGKKHILTPAKCAFRILWDHLHPKPGERWEDNPWVFPYVFERIER